MADSRPADSHQADRLAIVDGVNELKAFVDSKDSDVADALGKLLQMDHFDALSKRLAEQIRAYDQLIANNPDLPPLPAGTVGSLRANTQRLAAIQTKLSEQLERSGVEASSVVKPRPRRRVEQKQTRRDKELAQIVTIQEMRGHINKIRDDATKLDQLNLSGASGPRLRQLIAELESLIEKLQDRLSEATSAFSSKLSFRSLSVEVEEILNILSRQRDRLQRAQQLAMRAKRRAPPPPPRRVNPELARRIAARIEQRISQMRDLANKMTLLFQRTDEQKIADGRAIIAYYESAESDVEDLLSLARSIQASWEDLADVAQIVEAAEKLTQDDRFVENSSDALSADEARLTLNKLVGQAQALESILGAYASTGDAKLDSPARYLMCQLLMLKANALKFDVPEMQEAHAYAQQIIDETTRRFPWNDENTRCAINLYANLGFKKFDSLAWNYADLKERYGDNPSEEELNTLIDLAQKMKDAGKEYNDKLASLQRAVEAQNDPALDEIKEQYDLSEELQSIDRDLEAMDARLRDLETQEMLPESPSEISQELAARGKPTHHMQTAIPLPPSEEEQSQIGAQVVQLTDQLTQRSSQQLSEQPAETLGEQSQEFGTAGGLQFNSPTQFGQPRSSQVEEFASDAKSQDNLQDSLDAFYNDIVGLAGKKKFAYITAKRQNGPTSYSSFDGFGFSKSHAMSNEQVETTRDYFLKGCVWDCTSTPRPPFVYSPELFQGYKQELIPLPS